MVHKTILQLKTKYLHKQERFSYLVQNIITVFISETDWQLGLPIVFHIFKKSDANTNTMSRRNSHLITVGMLCTNKIS